MQRIETKPSPVGKFLKCKNPENYFTNEELQLLKSDYQTAIDIRIWNANPLPPCKKASSVLDAHLLMDYLLKSCDRSLVCYQNLSKITVSTGLSIYRVRQLITALDEVGILKYTKRFTQLLPVPKGAITSIELNLQHYNSRLNHKIN